MLALILAPAVDALAMNPAPPVRHFINLSNGAEALQLLDQAGVPPEQISFLRIQSSHCEAQDFNGILQNLDHNLLMHLALGYECRVYDFGSRGNFWEADPSDPACDEVVKKYVPRALWWGLEWSRYALNHIWHLDGSQTPLLRGYNVETMFASKVNALPKALHKRLKYYRSHLAPGLSTVNLKGYYAGTVLDGDKAAYRAMLLAHTERSRDHLSSTPQPEDFVQSLELYDARTARRVGEMRGRQQLQ